MSDTYSYALLMEAQLYWDIGSPLPVDLFIAMNEEGIDIDNEYALSEAARKQSTTTAIAITTGDTQNGI
jgi:hypothetical protein